MIERKAIDRHSPDSPLFQPKLRRVGIFGKPEVPGAFWTDVGAGQFLAERQKMLRFPSSRRTAPMVCSELMTIERFTLSTQQVVAAVP
ncbi:MAG: hypothetical protein M3Z96_02055 [Pseudomonadota bacterium]|nr:hypothetical protein [Pseudomonadota bacterium]